MDAVADITAVCLLMDRLAPDEVVVSPIHVGSGQVRCTHGLLPVPAPATAWLLRDVPIYGGEIVGLLARILITIAIEMAIAVSAFGFREKKQLRVLIVVNCVTQILLNVLLNVTGYFNGPISFIVDYIFLETLVFVIEAVVYCIWLRKVSGFQRKKRVYVGYAWVSNTVSFIVGMIIARLLPGIF